MFFLDFLPLFITAFGIYFLIRLKFFFILHPVRVARRMLSLFKNKKIRQNLTLALAGTLGVGNIVGVAYGISVGGAGCVFWIFVSGIFASVLKYAESTLAADKREGKIGGIAYVLSKGRGGFGRASGILYSFLCIALSLSMGSALQSESFASSLGGGVRYEAMLSFIFTLCVGAVILGGANRIVKVTSHLIPTATVAYVLICLFIILKNLGALPEVFKNIITSAFDFRAMCGGVSTFFISKAMKEGFARGLLSNEAGAGTSAMAQSRSDISPSDTGLLGILEVFFDTTLLCTLTGVAILASGVSTEVGGVGIILLAFRQVFGRWGGTLLSALIFSFAFSTVICWYYYGVESLSFVFGKRSFTAYAILFLLASAVGFAVPVSHLMLISDLSLFFMSILTLFALYKNSERIILLSECGGLLKDSDRGKRLKAKR